MKRKLAVLALGLSLVSSCKQQPEKPAVDMKQFMAQHVAPTAQTYWDSVQYINDETGSHEIFPRTEADWKRTYQAAEKLKQHAQLLRTPAYAQGRGEDWNEFAEGLADVAGQAEQAAAAKSVDKVFEVGSSIYNVCSACHEVYMPVPGGLAPEDAAKTKSS